MLHPKTPLYGHLIIMDNLLCPWKKKHLHFFKFNPLNTGTQLIWTLSMAPLVSALTGVDSLTVPRLLGGGSEACFVTCRDTYSYS